MPLLTAAAAKHGAYYFLPFRSEVIACFAKAEGKGEMMGAAGAFAGGGALRRGGRGSPARGAGLSGEGTGLSGEGAGLLLFCNTFLHNWQNAA